MNDPLCRHNNLTSNNSASGETELQTENHTSEDKPTVLSRNEIRDLLHRFIGFIKASSFYPPGHNRRLSCFDAFMEQGQQLFDRDRKIEFIADAKTLTVNDETFDQEDSTVSAFLPDLIRRNIRSIRIDAKADPFEINALAYAITVDPEDDPTLGHAQDQLIGQGVKRIRIRAFSTTDHSTKSTGDHAADSVSHPSPGSGSGRSRGGSIGGDEAANSLKPNAYEILSSGQNGFAEYEDEASIGDEQKSDSSSETNSYSNATPITNDYSSATPESIEYADPFSNRKSNDDSSLELDPDSHAANQGAHADSDPGLDMDSSGYEPEPNMHDPESQIHDFSNHDIPNHESINRESSAATAEVPSAQPPASQPSPTLEDDPQAWLDALGTHPDVRDELEWFDEVLKSGDADTTVDKHDLLLAMTTSFLQSSPETTRPDGNAQEAIACGLKTLRVRVTKEADGEEKPSALEILDRIATRMMQDPDSIFKWLAETDENLDLGAATSMGELMKATFTRSKTGVRSMPFGETELQTLKSPSKEEDPHNPGKAQTPQEGPTLSDVFKLYVRLKRSVGNRRFDLSLQDVEEAHFHILNDLLLREADPQARARIANVLKLFLATHLEEENEENSPFKFEYIEERIFKLRHDEQALITQTPSIFRRILSELQWGEQRWYGTLTRMARNSPEEFAEQLGEWCLSEHASTEISEIQSLVTTSEKAIIPWLDKKTRAQMDGKEADSLAGLALLCRRQTVLPVLERLLKSVSGDLSGRVMRKLIDSKVPACIKTIAAELEQAEGNRKEMILHLLGDSPLTEAEDLLLARITNIKLTNNDTQSACAALWALGRCGTDRSLPELKKIKSNLLFLFTGNNRMIKNHADKAYRAVKNRIKRPGIR